MQGRLSRKAKPGRSVLKKVAKQTVHKQSAAQALGSPQLPPLPSLQITEGNVGSRCWVRGEEGLVRYRGPVYFAEGDWVGVQLRCPQRDWESVCDGAREGTRYFTTDAACGVFVRPGEVQTSLPSPEVQVANPISLLSVARRRSTSQLDKLSTGDESLCGWDDASSPVKEHSQRVHCRTADEPSLPPSPTPAEVPPPEPKQEPVPEPEPPCPPTPQEAPVVDPRMVVRSCLEQMHKLVDKAKDAYSAAVTEDSEAVRLKEAELKNVEPANELDLGQCESVTEEFCNTVAGLPEVGREILELVQQHPVPGHTTVDSDERLRRLHFDVEEITSLKEEAIIKGDVAAVEELFERSMACHEAISEELTTIITLLTTGEQQELEVLEQSVRRQKKVLKSKIECYKNQMGAMRQVAEEYFKETFGLLSSKEEAAHAKRRGVMSEVHESTKQIESNTQNATDNWSQLTDILREVSDIVTEQEQLVQRKLSDYDAVMVIDRSLYELRAKTVERESHCTCVTQKLDGLRAALDSNANTCLAAFKEAEDALRDKHSAHFDATLASHNNHYEGFKGVYMLLGEYQHKRVMHKEALAEKLKTEEELLEYYSQSLNPLAREHAVNRDNLQKSIDHLTLQVVALEDKLATHEQAFVETSEPPLLQAGRVFTHPKVELEKLKNKSIAKLIAYKNLEET